ncbi:MAG TPA: murein biosynthesis integral membrane protein MurJ, partial [Gammaproteobacteria bacterium]|nr:murein biosynthesis integral membrane protein MurJ [Gammaproteobacteria bacterium]
MLRSSLVVTASSVFGLAVGFAREILIVRTWGAGATADSILVAVFIPEAFRMLLAGGVLVSATLPLWLACEDRATRRAWSATLTLSILAAVTVLVAILLLLDNACIWVIGPGLEPYARESAVSLFHIAIFALPGLFLQALLTTQHHANNAFLWPALGALLFNIPGVSYLLWAGAQSTPQGFVISLIIGSVLTALPLLPRAWRNDWRPFGSLQLTF